VAVEEYSRVVAGLRRAYGPAAAAGRDGWEREAFKVDERRRFLDLLRTRGAGSLLEVGAGTGHDSLYFQGQGLRVLCTDLSPAMAGLCRAKGLDAQVADFPGLGVPPASSDAGLFYAGTWGGVNKEGPVRDDHHPVPASSRSARTGG